MRKVLIYVKMMDWLQEILHLMEQKFTFVDTLLILEEKGHLKDQNIMKLHHDLLLCSLGKMNINEVDIEGVPLHVMIFFKHFASSSCWKQACMCVMHYLDTMIFIYQMVKKTLIESMSVILFVLVFGIIRIPMIHSLVRLGNVSMSNTMYLDALKLVQTGYFDAILLLYALAYILFRILKHGGLKQIQKFHHWKCFGIQFLHAVSEKVNQKDLSDITMIMVEQSKFPLYYINLYIFLVNKSLKEALIESEIIDMQKENLFKMNCNRYGLDRSSNLMMLETMEDYKQTAQKEINMWLKSLQMVFVIYLLIMSFSILLPMLHILM